MIKIIKLSVILILLLLSTNINTTNAAEYVAPVYKVASNDSYIGWAEMSRQITDNYLREIGYDSKKLNINVLKDRIARLYASIQQGYGVGDGIYHSYQEIYDMKMNDERGIVRFENGILIVGCGNKDLLSYTLTTPTPGSCVSLSVDNNGNFSCIGNSTAKNYRIYVNGIYKTSRQSGNYNVSNPGTYNFECRVDNEVATKNSCRKTVVTAPKPVPGDCTGLTVGNDGRYTCTGNETASDYKISVNGSVVSDNSSGYYNISNPGTYNFECRVKGESIADNECKQTVVIVAPKYDLALRKTVVSTGPYNIGDTIKYKIDVINQGNIDAHNIEITDYIPANMEFVTSPGWSTPVAGKTVNKTITILAKGDTKSIFINLRVGENANGIIKNFAEISKDDGNDCDSTPDSTNGNGTGESTGMIDDNIGNGCNSGGDEDDHDVAPITVVNPQFDLAITKEIITDAPHQAGDIIEYKIIVTNQGDYDATNVEVTDYIPNQMEFIPSTGWSTPVAGKTVNTTINSLAKKTSTFLILKLKIKSGLSDGTKIKNWAEISNADGGIDCDSTPDTNPNNDTESEDYSENNPNPMGCHKNSGDEDDIDPAELEIGGTFDLALKKEVVTSGPYHIGDTVSYKITVKNQGTIEAKNIEVTDYIPSNMEFIPSTGWSTPVAGKTVNKTISTLAAGATKELFINLRIKSGVSDGTSIKNYAEISEDNAIDCDSTADDTNGNGTGESTGLVDNDMGDSCNSGGDEDDHDVEEITVVDKRYDLALKKTVVSTSPYNVGDTIIYKIEVINQGEIEAHNIEVTDYIPTNMEFIASTGWSTPVAGKTVNKTISTLAAGSTKELFISLKIKSGISVGTSIKNFAEISADDGEDCDSTTDNINGNGTGESTGIIDNNIGNGCNSDGDEDDHDVEEILVGDIAVCEADLTGALNYMISANTNGLCKNSGEVVVNFTSTQNGNTTNYIWSCKDTDNVVHNLGNCNASYTSGGGGGSNPQCYDIIKKSSTQYSCLVNEKTYNSGTVGIDCDGDGRYEQVARGSSLTRDSNGRYVATFTCAQKELSDGTKVDPAPKCAVQSGNVSANQSAGWSTNFQCRMTPDPKTCGDGRVDSPNDNGINEECDLGSNNSSDSTCSTSCKLNSKDGNTFTPNCTNSFKYYNEHKAECDLTNTIPTGGEISITNVSNFAIGHNQKVFKKNGSYYEFNTDNVVNNKALFVKNMGDTAINLDDYLCIIDRGNKGEIVYGDPNYNGDDQTILSGNNEYCENSTMKFLYPGEARYFNPNGNLENIKGNTSNFGTDRIKTSHLVLTVKNGGSTYDWSPILSGHMFITVAKPGVASQGGGTTYVANSGKFTNVNNIAEKVESNNGINNVTTTINANQSNFTSTVLGDSDDLSNIETVTDTTEAEEEATEIEDNSNVITDNITATDFESYRGLNNVYAKKGGISISSINIDTTKPVTYIIENGDLTIDKDISSSKNIAFIVKNGNIIVKDNVAELDGTYVNIGGKIKGDNTTNRLTVNGSMYGDLSELTKNRTHVSMDEEGNINVGTLISFGSNVLNKPAPLVGQFIKEYQTSSKVAK